jgi:GR25 family glycosyltransferase involved in LPS biosynthesis
MKAVVINLDRDAVRMDLFRKRFAEVPQLDISRTSGVFGRDLPRLARRSLSSSDFWADFRGEIGCFLSHVNVWESIFRADLIHLVLEDDAIPNGLSRLFELSLPNDADLVFVNSRMCPSKGVGETLQLLPIIESVRLLNRTGEGVGAEGYILTPVGAGKLLEAIESDGFFGNVDWRMLRYSLKPEDLKDDLVGSRCDEVIRNHHNHLLPPQWGVVMAYCLNDPLIRLPDQNTSSIRDANN